MVDQPAFRKALRFYVGLVRDAGERDAADTSFNECLRQYLNGKVAMWYDATVAAGAARGLQQRGERQERLRLRPG